MTTAMFDTLKFAGSLRESGFDERQSTGLANAMREVQASSLDGFVAQLATKDDIANIKDDIANIKDDIANIKDDIANVRVDLAKLEHDISLQMLELRRDIKESEYRMTIRLGALVVAAVGFLKYFPSVH